MLPLPVQRLVEIVNRMEDVLICFDEALCVTYATPSLSRLVSHAPEGLIGQPAATLMAPASAEVFVAWARAHDQTTPAPLRAADQRLDLQLAGGNRARWTEWLIQRLDESGSGGGFFAVVRDIEHRREKYAEVEFLADHDALTRLPNRRMFEACLERALKQATRRMTQMAVVALDLDLFSKVNDRYGHPAGDDLLKQMSERLRHRLRVEDTLARLGGDEFCVIVESQDGPKGAARVAQALLDEIREPFLLTGFGQIEITASIGIAVYPDHGKSVVQLMANADTALYQAKRNGRSQFQYFTEQMTESMRARMALETLLRQAVEHSELAVVYQPIVSVASGQVVGAEAFVRWRAPDGELVLPNRFLAVAEETGLIGPIGDWVLRTACHQARAWADSSLPRMTVSVNLSALQFQRENLADTVKQILQDSGLPPDQLELEITEAALMPLNERDPVQILADLKAIGVRIAIDDFGTGYSCLAALSQISVDRLKIDHRFVQSLSHTKAATVVVQSVIMLADQLGCEVLAEGVETGAQLERLSEKGCHTYQGYHYSRPLLATQFAERVAMDEARRTASLP